MYTRFVDTKKGTLAYIQKSVRVDGYPRTITVKSLGLLSDIEKEHGCANPREWVEALAASMTAEEKESRRKITVELSPTKTVETGAHPLRHGGDLMLLGLYSRLGLPDICDTIVKGSRVKYDLNEILRTLVTSLILFPCSKRRTMELAKGYVKPPKFKENDMFRALSLLSGHIDLIQAGVYRNSLSILPRRDKVIFYDCTNYYFEIEDNDPDIMDKETGEVIAGLRKSGKSKEHRPNPIVQMGMFMDYDGIPLAFKIFPGNESEQKSLQPLEEVLNHCFGMTDYVVSSDAGLASEDPRHYVTTTHKTKNGERAVRIEMAIDTDVVAQEEILDGFYAYGTSLDDDAIDVLRIRSFHHEIEHIFRTTKSFLDARPVFLSRQDRIKSHFLICFLAMVILKILQRQLTVANHDNYASEPLPIDRLINTLRDIRFAHLEGHGYLPMFTRSDLTDQLEKLTHTTISTQIIPTRKMTANYRNVKF